MMTLRQFGLCFLLGIALGPLGLMNFILALVVVLLLINEVMKENK